MIRLYPPLSCPTIQERREVDAHSIIDIQDDAPAFSIAVLRSYLPTVLQS
jgi:hypothetical protein